MFANVRLHQGGLLSRFLLASIQWYEVAMLVFSMHVVLDTLENEFCITLVFDSERFTKTDTYSWNVHASRQ